jgi:uncharacterized cupredoxin-like copper-binding protein
MGTKPLLTGVAVITLLLGACGDDDDDDARGAADNVLTVKETEYAFGFGGAPKAGTVTFAVENTGKELHVFALGRLLPGKTLEDARAALASEDEDASATLFADDAAADSAGAGLTPGGKYELTVSGIEPGKYVAICFLPGPDGTPHFASGMIGEFDVAAGDDGAMPEADVTFTVTKERIDGPREVKAGRTTIKVVPQAGAPDEVTLVKIKDGNTADDVDAYFESLEEEEDGFFYDVEASPADLVVFAFDSTVERSLTVDLTPGKWGIGAEDSDVEDAPDLDPDEDPHLIQFTVT